MPQTELPNREAAILGRLVGPDMSTLSPAAAEALLTLGFCLADKDRTHKLAATARAGTLTPDEQAEAEAYSHIGSLLGILKSKARQDLERHGSLAGENFPQ